MLANITSPEKEQILVLTVRPKFSGDTLPRQGQNMAMQPTPNQCGAEIEELLRRTADAPLSASELEEMRHAAGGGFPAAFIDAIEAEIYAEDADASAVTAKATVGNS